MRGFLDELWPPIAAQGSCEFVAAIAKPYPALTIAAVLGAPRSDASQLQEWSSLIQRQFDIQALAMQVPQIERAAVEVYGYVERLLAERRAAPVTGTVTKTSAGASEYLPIAKVTNIARTVEELKERNIWTVGLDERGPQTYDALDYNMDCALVLGAEGKGLHDLVKRKCDFLVSIPMLGKVPSLNVSVAGAIVMYEIVRQRRMQGRAQEKDVSSGAK